MDPVQLLRAEAGSAPSGTGSFSYFSNFVVVVQNLAYNKVVGIWGHETQADAWRFHPCVFDRSVPGNLELWTAHVVAPIDQFAVEYQAVGQIFWDNNAGFNYVLDVRAAESTDGVGTAAMNPNILVVGWDVDSTGKLVVEALVRNVTYQKQIAIVYTTDNWRTFQNAFGTYSQSFPPGSSPHQINCELWQISAPVGSGVNGEFAAFCVAQNTVSWDNNFQRNFPFTH